MRDNGIEAHYLFHAIPMQGMRHHRTSVKKGAELAMRLSASGEFSGRAKPHYALMTDIGKIVLYDGAIIAHRPSDNSLLLRSGYRLEDRKKWNPSWRIPASVQVDDEGFMCVWYKDGEDEAWSELGLWGNLPLASNDTGPRGEFDRGLALQRFPEPDRALDLFEAERGVGAFADRILEQRVGRHLGIAVLATAHCSAARTSAPPMPLRGARPARRTSLDERHRRAVAAIRIGPQRQFQHADDLAIGPRRRTRGAAGAARHAPRSSAPTSSRNSSTFASGHNAARMASQASASALVASLIFILREYPSPLAGEGCEALASEASLGEAG